MVTDYIKQIELIDVSKFTEEIHVVGVGALGSWVAFFLAKMGFKKIHLWDFDTIEEHNLPNQNYRYKDIGTLKVKAAHDIIQESITDGTLTWRTITVHDEKITEENAYALNGIIFVCVDSMKTRKNIYEWVYKYGSNQIELYIEARLSLFGAYMYTLNMKRMNILKQYEKSLYNDEETELSVCGVSQTALPSAANTASMMVMQMISWFRKNEIYNEILWQIPDLVCTKNIWSETEE